MSKGERQLPRSGQTIHSLKVGGLAPDVILDHLGCPWWHFNIARTPWAQARRQRYRTQMQSLYDRI